MIIADIQEIGSSLPGVTSDIKWEDHLCFNIGQKMFLITSPDATPPTASFKVPAEDFEAMVAKPGFSPAPYLARYHWVYVEDVGRVNKKDWAFYIRQSYELISAKLPRKLKIESGIPV